jgi:3-deoxy-D-manno-octulosonic-acid transferase
MRFIYNLLWPLGLLLFLPGYILKMFRRGGYRNKFGQRLGWYDVDLRARLEKERPTWLHAVSVGEVAVALKLASQLRALDPNLPCVLTTTTTTGFAFATRNAPDWIEVMYTPLDFWPIMRHALSVIRPARIILVEAEVWPNLVAQAHAQQIPLALVNARLSPRSERRFRQFRFAVAPTFGLLNLVCVQQPEDVERWAALGVRHERIRHVGAIKFDPENVHVDPAVPERILSALKIDKGCPVIFGGSTHSGEEEILGRVFRDLRAEFPGLFLIVAPRHAERAREVQAKLQELSLRVVLRSETTGVPATAADCLVLDTTGELRHWYAAATIVFMGKSLTARGGQNPVEPILAGKPVLFGPHMENFSALAQTLVASAAALQVADADSLRLKAAELLRDPGACARLVANARDVLAIHHGATARTARLLSDLNSITADR